MMNLVGLRDSMYSEKFRFFESLNNKGVLSCVES